MSCDTRERRVESAFFLDIAPGSQLVFVPQGTNECLLTTVGFQPETIGLPTILLVQYFHSRS
jgi:hypothetical protein